MTLRVKNLKKKKKKKKKYLFLSDLVCKSWQIISTSVLEISLFN